MVNSLGLLRAIERLTFLTEDPSAKDPVALQTGNDGTWIWVTDATLRVAVFERTRAEQAVKDYELLGGKARIVTPPSPQSPP